MQIKLYGPQQGEDTISSLGVYCLVANVLPHNINNKVWSIPLTLILKILELLLLLNSSGSGPARSEQTTETCMLREARFSPVPPSVHYGLS